MQALGISSLLWQLAPLAAQPRASLHHVSAAGRQAALKQGRGQSNNNDLSALRYRRKNEKPLPNSLGLPPRRIEPAERISCNTGQRLLSERVGEMNKRVQLEEELRIPRYSFCLRPAACPPPPWRGYSLRDLGWLQQWRVTLRLHPRLEEMRIVACVTDVFWQERKAIPRQDAGRQSNGHRSITPQPTLPSLPCPTSSCFHARSPSLLQHTGSHRGWAFSSPS